MEEVSKLPCKGLLFYSAGLATFMASHGYSSCKIEADLKQVPLFWLVWLSG